MSFNKNPATILEGFSKRFAVFVCLDNLAEGSMLSGYIYIHSRCFIDI